MVEESTGSYIPEKGKYNGCCGYTYVYILYRLVCTHLLMHCGRGCHLFYLVFLLLSGIWQLFGFSPARGTEEWVSMLGLRYMVEWVSRLGRGGGVTR